MALKKLVAGNWKMHGLSSDLDEIAAIADASRPYPAVDVALVRPGDPDRARGARRARLRDRRRRTSTMPTRARIPAARRRAMLLDAGASLTIVGHSERRDAQRESDAEVKAKAEAALARRARRRSSASAKASRSARAGARSRRSCAQLDGSLPDELDDKAELAIAYEPIWAIGTGKIPTATRSRRCMRAIRARLRRALRRRGEQVRILYGGSVKASNAAEIFAVADVDGALVGGASLKAADFIPIVAAAAAR